MNVATSGRSYWSGGTLGEVNRTGIHSIQGPTSLIEGVLMRGDMVE